MFKIDPPIVDDMEELQLLANNNNLGSYPELMYRYIEFKTQYIEYSNNSGDPWLVSALTIGQNFKKELKTHYENPPKDRLEFIKNYRRKLTPTLCPMCGGFGNGTLDHYLPKTDYPEFSFFSKNLVPACNCNSLRKTNVKGAASPERVIHPYYDNFLDERLYQVVFTGDYEAPTITIDVVDSNHTNIDTLIFHLDKVILNDATQGWLETFWADLTRRPHEILCAVLPDDKSTVNGIRLTGYIKRQRDIKDNEHGTPNNWYSMFYTGLMNDQPRVDKLAETIN